MCSRRRDTGYLLPHLFFKLFDFRFQFGYLFAIIILREIDINGVDEVLFRIGRRDQLVRELQELWSHLPSLPNPRL